MKRLFFRGLIGIVFIFVANGCDALDSGESESSSGDITFSVKEVHSTRAEYNAPVEPFIELQMQTKEIFPCTNYPLISNLSRDGNTLDIEIIGVEEGGVCLTALGSATARLKLDLDPGTYTLNFNDHGRHNRATLTITDEKLVVSAPDTDFMILQTDLFWRYPERSFAYLCTVTDETRWMCNEFEQLLKESLNIASFTFPDEGTIPYPEVGKQYDIAAYYTYPNERIYTKARSMLNAYADSVVNHQQEGAYLSVTNWKDQGAYSWTDIDD